MKNEAQTDVKFPQMREELLGTLTSLSEESYQQRVWIEHKLPAGHTPKTFYDSFDLVVHFLFDDTHLADNPKKTIGSILKNSSEAEAIKTLTQKIDRVLQVVGNQGSDKDYISSAEWPEVIDAAKAALKVLNNS